MRTQLSTLALAGFILLGSGIASAQAPDRAQPGRRPMPDAADRGLGVTEILNARRALDLSPRQVAQLDSIERALWEDRQRVREQMRPMGDSLRASMRRDGAPRDSASRAALRRQMEARRAAMRPQMERLRQRDSTARVAADRVLNDAQRTKAREMQAERRGFERGMRTGRGEDGHRGAMAGRGGRAGGAGRTGPAGRPHGRQMAPRSPQRPPR